jgi:antibiotic biosynthesis monooxygenase
MPRAGRREVNRTRGVKHPMFTVLQRYRVRLGNVADAAERAEETLLPRLKQETGFVAYHLLDSGDSTVTVMAVFETRPAADAAARLLREWFRSDWPAFRLLAPDLSVAEALTVEQANAVEGMALQSHADEERVASYGYMPADQAIGTNPRVAGDRRMRGERRLVTVACETERRSGLERRITLERRSTSERRGVLVPTEAAAIPERRRIAPAWRRREMFHSR